MSGESPIIMPPDAPQRAVAHDNLGQSTLLARRYEILKVVGRGGMSTVYAARDLRFSSAIKIVAVKEMAQVGGSADDRERALALFEREANLLAGLSHPAIPKVFDFFSENKRAYLIQEFIDGRDLETVLNTSQDVMPQDRVVAWAVQVCDVLHYLHTHQPQPIVFRDMKPSNVMLTADGRIVLIDFGIAKIFQSRKGTMIGTEGYAPPEQYRGLAEPRGDIYALGAMSHHLLSRTDPRLEPPFTFAERPISAYNKTVQPELEQVVTRSLAYAPDDRYATATEFKDALLNALGVGTGVTRGTSALARTAFLKNAAPSAGPTVRWQYPTGDEVRATPALAPLRDIVVVGSYDHAIYGLDAKSGRLLWSFETGRGVCTTPLIVGDTVVIGSEDQTVYALSLTTGKKIWATPTRGWVRSSACLVTPDTVAVGTGDGGLLCLSLATGQEVWAFRTWQPIISSPTSANGLIYVGCEDSTLYAVDATNGTGKWKYQALRPITSSPVVHDGLVIVGSIDGHVYAFDAAMGWPVWKFKTQHSISSSPRVRQGLIVVGSVDSHVYAIEARTGKQAWKFATDGPVTASAALTDSHVYIGSIDSMFYCLDLRTGKLVWKHQAGGPIPGSAVWMGDGVCFGSNDSLVTCLSIS